MQYLLSVAARPVLSGGSRLLLTLHLLHFLGEDLLGFVHILHVLSRGRSWLQTLGLARTVFFFLLL